jgi:hypothetical protein
MTMKAIIAITTMIAAKTSSSTGPMLTIFLSVGGEKMPCAGYV